MSSTTWLSNAPNAWCNHTSIEFCSISCSRRVGNGRSSGLPKGKYYCSIMDL
ncbi:unnamed protein product [Strongylus vulgaris]|uniref:Uncharacterized protein n=1 Tax=Strongylus vulgaris TaxID=40348 RepID=A0A3P7M3M7_STRVU|nr:unnamed protein product [Strongylus vulgaris]